MTANKSVPSVSVQYAATGSSTKSNELGMRQMQEGAYGKRGEQYLLIKSPPASGKSRALMFSARDKLHNHGLKRAIMVVPEKHIWASFNDEVLECIYISRRFENDPELLENLPEMHRKMEARS